MQLSTANRRDVIEDLLYQDLSSDGQSDQRSHENKERSSKI